MLEEIFCLKIYKQFAFSSPKFPLQKNYYLMHKTMDIYDPF